MQRDIPSEWRLEELLADIGEVPLSDPGEGYLTTREWARVWGVSERRAREHIAAAISAGAMCASERAARRIDGRAYLQPVYRVIPKDERKGNDGTV